MGSRADLTVVEPNPFEIATEELPTVRAALTMVAGMSRVAVGNLAAC